MLRSSDLDVFHGDAQALDGVSLEVAEGAIVAIVGANGAGKTSLIRTIAGMHRPARGRIMLSRHRHRRLAELPGLQSRHRPGGRGPPGVSDPVGRREPRHGRDAAARARATRARNRERVFALFPVLAERTQAGGRHAFGRRAADARHRPLPDGRARAGDVRRALARPRARDRAGRAARPSAISTATGLTCVLVEQNVAVSLKLASRAYVLENGRITLSGTGEELLADDRVRQAYLGTVT